MLTLQVFPEAYDICQDKSSFYCFDFYRKRKNENVGRHSEFKDNFFLSIVWTETLNYNQVQRNNRLQKFHEKSQRP